MMRCSAAFFLLKMIHNYVQRNEAPEDDEYSKASPVMAVQDGISWPFWVWEGHSDGEHADEQGVASAVR